MDAPADYLHWGFILLSVPNLVIVSIMLVLSLLLVLVPFIPGLRDIPKVDAYLPPDLAFSLGQAIRSLALRSNRLRQMRRRGRFLVQVNHP